MKNMKDIKDILEKFDMKDLNLIFDEGSPGRAFVREFLSNWTLDNGKYKLEVDLPGLKKEEVKVMVEGDMLKIEAKRAYKLGGKDATKDYSSSHSFPRKFSPEGLSASLDSGVLTLLVDPTIKPQSREIPVK